MTSTIHTIKVSPEEIYDIKLEHSLLEANAKIATANGALLESRGGNVELLSLQNDVARLRLQGTRKSCPSSSVTLELAVWQAIEEACPDLAGFEVEGVNSQPQASAPGLCLATP